MDNTNENKVSFKEKIKAKWQRFLKISLNFNKLINISLETIVLVLATLAIVFSFTQVLLSGVESTVRDFKMYTHMSYDYSLLKISDFSNTFIAYSTKNTQLNEFITFTERNVNAAKILKIMPIIIFGAECLFVLFQGFENREIYCMIYSTLVLGLFILFKNFAISQFRATGLITSATGYYVAIIIFWILNIGLGALKYSYKNYVIKINKQKQELLKKA